MGGAGSRHHVVLLDDVIDVLWRFAQYPGDLLRCWLPQRQ